MYKDNICCVILTTTNVKSVAELLANGLIESGNAACVQINEIESFYKEAGEVKKTNEYRLTIKAKNNKYKDIEKFVLDRHNYNLPQIIKLEITEGFSDYLNWINS